VILILVPLQVFANVATIVLDESGPAVKGWFTWRDIFHLLDIICCCAILFPIVWSIKHLRDAAQTDGKVRAHASFVSTPPTIHMSIAVPSYKPHAHGHHRHGNSTWVMLTSAAATCRDPRRARATW
jgi:hypothetical protein